MPKVLINDIEIYYEQRGDPNDPALLHIAGLGAQITGWQAGFLQRLVDAGFYVTIFDNRDVGYSSWLTHHGVPDSEKILSGEDQATYLISDMADDAAGLVRELRLGPVHVVGVSMGGMIAQQFAIDHAEVTKSLTSIMSSPAPMVVGQPTPEALASLVATRSEEFEAFMIEEIHSWRVTSGSKFPIDEIWIREQAEVAWRRGRNPEGVARHLAAVVQSPDRRPGLTNVTVPSLVLHGEEDPLVSPSGGEATAKALPNVTHVTYPGWGHSVPSEMWDEITREIVGVAKQAS